MTRIYCLGFRLGSSSGLCNSRPRHLFLCHTEIWWYSALEPAMPLRFPLLYSWTFLKFLFGDRGCPLCDPVHTCSCQISFACIVESLTFSRFFQFELYHRVFPASDFNEWLFLKFCHMAVLLYWLRPFKIPCGNYGLAWKVINQEAPYGICSPATVTAFNSTLLISIEGVIRTRKRKHHFAVL